MSYPVPVTGLVSILHLLNWPYFAFLTFEMDVNCTVMLVICPKFGSSWCIITFERDYFFI